MTPTLACIGLGAMGAPMLQHWLRAGFAGRVYARSAGSAAVAQRLGVPTFATPAEAARGADFVITNVTSTEDVESVLCGEHGAMHGAAAGTLCIDHSTILPEGARRIAATLAARGIGFVDAPVSGGTKGAQEGSLTVMVGGSQADVQRAMPLLRAIGRNIRHVGPVGAGQVAKACNQIIQVVNIEGIAEAMLYAQAQGVDRHAVLQAIATGFAGSRMLDLMGPKMADDDFSAGIEARLHAKDFGLIAESARQLGLELPLVRQVRQQLDALVAAGWGRDDTSSLLRVLRARQPAAGEPNG